jgi:hypothetical protein
MAAMECAAVVTVREGGQLDTEPGKGYVLVKGHLTRQPAAEAPVGPAIYCYCSPRHRHVL